MGKDFSESVDVLFHKVEDLVSTKTVVGEAITLDGLTLLPLIEVAVGVGAGAKENVNAAGGMGAKITPSAVLVIQGDSVQMINIKNQDAVSKLIDMAPGVVNKLNFGVRKKDLPMNRKNPLSLRKKPSSKNNAEKTPAGMCRKGERP